MNTGKCKQCDLSHAALDVIQSGFVYQDNSAVQHLIHHVKFGGYARLISQMVAHADMPAVSHVPQQHVVLVPVPLHRSREKHRGYNQAVLIGKAIRAKTGLGMEQLLARQRETLPQATLSAQDRQDNVRGAFVSTGLVDPAKRYMLIDDVMTTGSTLQSAAQALRAAGARWVGTWVLARVRYDSSQLIV